MAELDQISVDADGIPSAAGTDTVPTLAQIRDKLDEVITAVNSGTVTPGQTTAANSLSVVGASDAKATGVKAVVFGTNPTAVAAGDPLFLAATRGNIFFVLGGHPNTITRSHYITAAQTNLALVSAAAGAKIVVTRLSVKRLSTTSVAVTVTIGLGASATPTPASAGTNKILWDGDVAEGVPGEVAGNGGAVLGVGADAEDLFLTCSVPTGGALIVTYSYHTVES